jgi:hypothetical protein
MLGQHREHHLYLREGWAKFGLVVCTFTFSTIAFLILNANQPRINRNGDHVYQFYKAGFRPLNDPDAVHKVSITAWLPTAVPSGTIAKPTCEKDCRGFIPNPQWCNENCPCARKGSVC